MARFELKLPDIGEGVHEGEIAAWHVAVGDRVAEDDPIVDVMTDKANVTIGAPRAGTIRALRFEVGAVAHVGEVLVEIETDEAASRLPSARPSSPAATAVGDIRDALPGTEHFGEGSAAAKRNGNGHGPKGRPSARPAAATPSRVAALDASMSVDYFSAKPLATPATRKLARELGVDLHRVRPTGKDGRVTKDDVAAVAGAQPTEAHVTVPPTEADATMIPFVGVRRRIAEHLRTAVREAVHFTFVEECEATALLELRERLRPHAEARGIRLTYVPFIAKAVTRALARHPVLNGRLDEARQAIVCPHVVHLGIATATERGLLVPVVRDAHARSILDLATEIERLSEGARRGTLRPNELSGSTFTVTSLGKQSGLFATPILNHPEVGILGVHRIKKRPIVRDDRVVVGDVMLLSLSFDHRIVDGHVGAAFAYDVIAQLEAPEAMLLDSV